MSSITILLKGSIGIIGAIREIGAKAEDSKNLHNKNRFSSGVDEDIAKEEGEEDILLEKKKKTLRKCGSFFC